MGGRGLVRAAAGATTGAFYGAVMLLAFWLLQVGDTPPPGESGYLPLTAFTFLLYVCIVGSVAAITAVAGLILGALGGLALAPLVARVRQRPGVLAAAVWAVLAGGGVALLRDFALPGTLTELERVLLFAVLPTALAGGAGARHVLRAARGRVAEIRSPTAA